MSEIPSEPRRWANLPRGLAPLGFQDFALYWLGFVTTNVGRWVELMGLIWLVYRLTDSPFLVGLLGAARAVPVIVLSPIGGVVADRVNPRLILYVTQAAGLFASLFLAVLIMTGLVDLWHIYLQVVVQAAITAFDAAARQTLFPRLVPHPILAKAVTLTVTAARVSKFVGPLLGGVLIAGWGVSSPFFVNAASFLGLMAALAWMHIPASEKGVQLLASFRGELIEGARYVLSAPVISGLFVVEIVFGIFQLNPVSIAIIGHEILDVGPEGLGLLLSAPALGSFVAIVWLVAAEGTRYTGRFSLCAGFVYAAALAFVALPWSYGIVFAGFVVIGALEVIVTVTRNAILQLAAPNHMRGRIMANMGLVTRGIGPFAETQSGTLAVLIGPHIAVMAAATAIGLVTALTAYFNRSLWRFSL